MASPYQKSGQKAKKAMWKWREVSRELNNDVLCRLEYPGLHKHDELLKSSPILSRVLH